MAMVSSLAVQNTRECNPRHCQPLGGIGHGQPQRNEGFFKKYLARMGRVCIMVTFP